MIIRVSKGDLFKLDSKYTLVQCISEDCAMGAGIATEFQKRFKMRDYLLETIVQASKYFPCAILYPFSNPRVINMVTKKKYWNKPTYESFTKALEEVKDICIKQNIKYLGMPKIGCGLDRLQWGKVEEIIKGIFKDIDIQIEVKYI